MNKFIRNNELFFASDKCMSKKHATAAGILCCEVTIELPPGKWLLEITAMVVHENSSLWVGIDQDYESEKWGSGTGNDWDVTTISQIFPDISGGSDSSRKIWLKGSCTIKPNTILKSQINVTGYRQ